MPGPKTCDRCPQPATVHLTEIRAGKKTEQHLCESCARELQLPQAGQQELAKLLKSFEPMAALARRSLVESDRACPHCGITWAEFRQRGRFGCAHDYEVFRAEVERLLKRIHGADLYAGKAPPGRSTLPPEAPEAERAGGQLADEAPAAQPPDEIEQKRKALEQAVAAENYEEAARLRDELSRLDPDSSGRRRKRGTGPAGADA